MKFEVEATANLERELKKLLKKCNSLRSKVKELIHSSEVNPNQGTPIGMNCHKIRLAIASKGKGKSGGARIITHLLIQDKKVYLLSIFDKSDKENISNAEILSILKNLDTQ